MDDTLSDLYRHIAKIKQEESNEHWMSDYIEKHMDKLHAAISINSTMPAVTLLEFVLDYIDSVPDYLDAINTLAIESKTSAYIKPFINLTLMFFIKPPELLLQHKGVRRLLYQSYLANRLLEELNDQITSLGSIPLSPMDISMDNIICHALIGDELAYQLDHLVLISLETTESDKSVFNNPQTQAFLEKIKKDNWEGIKKRWPCFTKDLAINLRIGGY